VAGQCCCINERDPLGQARCWTVSSPDQCPVSVDCAYQESGPLNGVCTAARMANTNLVTPFEDRPEMLSAVADTYETMYDVRDLLATSDLGRRVLDYGKVVSDETNRIAQEDPDLSARIFDTMMRALSFARAMDRERRSPGTAPFERRFSEADFVFGERVAEDVRRRTSDETLIAALSDLRDQAARFVGLTPTEALAVFSDAPTGYTSA
jgi:hypothetical protein